MADENQSPRRLRDVGDRVFEAINRVRYPFGRQPNPSGWLVVLNSLTLVCLLVLVARHPMDGVWPKLYLGLLILSAEELVMNAWGLIRGGRLTPR